MMQEAILAGRREDAPHDIGLIAVRKDPGVGNDKREKISGPEDPCRASAISMIITATTHAVVQGW